jgi:hypothetical protein
MLPHEQFEISQANVKGTTDHGREIRKMLTGFYLTRDLRPLGIGGYGDEEGWISQVPSETSASAI